VSIAPAGTNPARLLKRMDPVTLQFKAPIMTSDDKSPPPITFRYDPTQV